MISLMFSDGWGQHKPFPLYHLPKLKMLTTLHAPLILLLLTKDEVRWVYLQWSYWSSFLSCNWIFPLQASCHWLLLAETDTDPVMPWRKPRLRIQLWTAQWAGIFIPTELTFITMSDGVFYVTPKRVLFRFVEWERWYYVTKTSKSNKICILLKLSIAIRNSRCSVSKNKSKSYLSGQIWVDNHLH